MRTGSGWHHYLAASGSGNRAGLLEHVDWRGRGGYVVALPSQHVAGSRNRWLRPLTSDLPDLPWPLRDLLVPARQQPPEPAPRFRKEPIGHAYGQAALQREFTAVAGAPKGRRNHTLYQAGIRLYSLVAGGILNHAEVHTGLLAAAETSRFSATSPPRPIAPWPRPNAPAWPTPAVSQPTTTRGDCAAASRAREPRRRDERARDG